VRHTFECPVRWADLDLLGHVNNVVYVDYLQEARVDMIRTHRPTQPAGELVDGLVVVRHEVQYLLPLTFRFRPVTIECWVTEIRAASFAMAYEIYDADPAEPSGRKVYVRATTVLTPYVFGEERPRRLSAEEKATLADFHEPTPRATRPEASPLRTSDTGHYPVAVRFSDVDVYGHVNNVKYFEYLQEARIAMMARLWGDDWGSAGRAQVVVAQTDVDYRVPILFRPEPYDAWTWISHVGRTSVVVESEIRDGSVVFARARVVLVFFDRTTQRPAVPEPAIRDPLVAFSRTS
jgi:acyl-CoA thioester hydrolase